MMKANSGRLAARDRAILHAIHKRRLEILKGMFNAPYKTEPAIKVAPLHWEGKSDENNKASA